MSHALVVDQEEPDGVRVVDAAGGSREHVDERRRESIAAVVVLRRHVMHRHLAGKPRRDDQHRFLERVSGSGLFGLV